LLPRHDPELPPHKMSKARAKEVNLCSTYSPGQEEVLSITKLRAFATQILVVAGGDVSLFGVWAASHEPMSRCVGR
jgi:hypothetical protein